MLENYVTPIAEIMSNVLNNLLNYKIGALIKYLDKTNAEETKRQIVMDEGITFVINQLSLLTNDYDSHQNPSVILRKKPEWLTKFAEEIAEKFNHFINIKNEHNIYKKGNE
ncbi:hypothetical protein [Spiroplasma sp. SV19]|uniref:hypothetical protein n=1 Tax=Spiroplasma sp. SV19 TaxID=2570468 RepID=UPI0024B820A1|nr:hypothetical protein [Spiroplasma sp. SV19]WHQ37371.1 hypothetical protein E7Y35_05840 [Spiroplasma sp. SV19]